MNIIGIDPSLTATGIAYEDGSTGTIKFPPSITGDRRLQWIADATAFAAQSVSGKPIGLAIVEDLPTHAHGSGITGMVQGVIRLQLIRSDVPYLTVPAATLKKFATGKGNATKADMRMDLYKCTGLDLKDDNQVDAWWLRALGRELLADPIVHLPKSHTDALGKLALPSGVTR